MIFTKDLLLKGLAGLAVCGGATTIGVHYYTGGFSSSSSEVKVTEGKLGLPEGCRFPAGGATTSCNLTTDNINNIKFDGKNTTPALTGTGTLQITIPGNDEKDIFPHGYKVTITASNSDITITRSSGDNIVLRTNQATDFKIKQNAGNTFSLEKVGKDEILAIKAGLKRKADGSGWTIDEAKSGISVKHGEATPEKNKTKAPAQQGVTEGKIKAYGDADATTYNQGFKFVIEDGDIVLAGSGTTITKLEQFETYEIKKEGTDWLLIRKSKAIDEIKTLLSLPTNASDCTEANAVTECSLDETKLKAIKFKGKVSGEVTVSDVNSANMKLKISKTTDANFTHGYKFVLESAKDITIPQNGGTPSSITIKAGTNTEFKIKKEGNSWSLEKAWTFDTLKTKVGLTTCQEDGGVKKCSFVNSSINVYDSATGFVKGASLADGNTDKKITYEEDVEGYNQGIKLYISDSEADITITGGTATGENVTAATTIYKRTSSTNGPSYEIKEIGGTWYLAKKSTGG